jgi:hypothetical protein
MKTLQEFTDLAGVPVHYARPPVAAYGSLGEPRRFRCTAKTRAALTALFEEIFAHGPAAFGAPVAILCAGAHVDKPGQHGLGKAFDLDGIHWERRRFLASEQRADRALYLMIQALCLRHFGVVLGFNFNAAHECHLHIDIGRPVRFRETRSATCFYQEALSTLFGAALTVDGEYGPQTETALIRTRKAMGLPPLSRPGAYCDFLLQVATVAAAAAAGRANTAAQAV